VCATNTGGPSQAASALRRVTVVFDGCDYVMAPVDEVLCVVKRRPAGAASPSSGGDLLEGDLLTKAAAAAAAPRI